MGAPVNKSQAYAFVERLRTANLAYQEHPKDRNVIVALCNANNDTLKAKRKMEKYYQSCPMEEVDQVREIISQLETVLDTVTIL